MKMAFIARLPKPDIAFNLIPAMKTMPSSVSPWPSLLDIINIKRRYVLHKQLSITHKKKSSPDLQPGKDTSASHHMCSIGITDAVLPQLGEIKQKSHYLYYLFKLTVIPHIE